ncbi:hypothetical protein GCM10020229_60430 [Kitasatospora albolonga]|uniref:CbtA family protein n=1 Tax=Kitasatospora albolonga TaxID=68173 RepID=UPI0031ED1EFB
MIAFAFAFFVGEGRSTSHRAGSAASAPRDVHGGDAAAPAAPAAEEKSELVSRSLQSTAGLATVSWSTGSRSAASPRCLQLRARPIGRFSPRAVRPPVSRRPAFTTVLPGAVLKYPATPPRVGNPDTIGKRTTLFFLMICWSVLLGVAALILGRRLAPRLGNWNASWWPASPSRWPSPWRSSLLPGNGDAIKTPSGRRLWKFRVHAGIQVVPLGRLRAGLRPAGGAPPGTNRQAPAAPQAAQPVPAD